MAPLWAKYSDLHPASVHWRMGAGEGYKIAFWAWWRTHAVTLDEAGRLAYLAQWPFAPAWTHIAAEMVWPDLSDDLDHVFDEGTEPRRRVFARAEAAGLPSEAAWWADFNDERWGA